MKKGTTMVMGVFTLGAVFLLAPIVGGCGSGGNHGIEEPSLVRTRSVTTANGLQITLSENNYFVEVGHSVIYTLTVTNTSNAPITYYTRYDCAPQLLPEVDSAVKVTNTATKEEVLVGNPEVTCASIGPEASKELVPGASITGSISSTPASGAKALTSPGTYEASVTLGASFVRTADPVIVSGLPVTVTN